MEFLPRRKSTSSLSLTGRHGSRLSVDSPTANPARCSSDDEGMTVDTDHDNDDHAQDMKPADNRVLKDVVAYVEVRTKMENRSNSVRKQLELLGAMVVQKFTNDEPVTHVVWKDGKQSTRDKAVRKGLHLVSVLWVDSCKQNQHRAAESLFPVTDSNDGSNITIPKTKRMKSMQPKSFEEDVESSTGRMVRKRKRKDPIQPSRPCIVSSPGTRIIGAAAKPFVYVEETQDPYTPVGTPVPGTRGTPSLIPDTPASMRACLDALGKVRNNTSTPRSGSEKPVIGESPTFGGKPDILQKKLSFSPSADANSSEDGIGKTDCETNLEKVVLLRRSVDGQGSTQTDPSKVRRLSLRIEKALCEQETDSNLSDHPEIPQTSPIQNGISPVGQKINSPRSKHLKDDFSRKASKNVIVCENDLPTNIKPSVKVRRKRKLLSTNTDSAPSQSLTEPTRSSKKDGYQKDPRLSRKSSRSLSDRFDTVKELNSDMDVGARQDENRNNESSVKRVPTSDVDGKTDKKSPREGKTARKRKKKESSAESSGEETSTVKKRKLCHKTAKSKEISPAMKTENPQIRDSTATSRKSLDDFAQNEQLNRLKTARKPRKNRSASLSTLNPDSTKSPNDIVSENSGQNSQKNSRSVSLAGDSSTRESNTLSEHPTEMKPCKEARATSEEPDVSSDERVGKAASQGKAKAAKSTKKLKSSIPSLVMTSVHRGDQDLVTSIVKKLKHFTMEDNVTATTTHIVCGETRRTLNLLRGIARGCWLVSLEWVLKSLAAEQWLPEEPFEICAAYPAVKMARLERCSAGASYKQDLFSTLGPVYIHKESSPPAASLAELIALCGGRTCFHSAPASLCIGGGGDQADAPIVSERWLLDSICQHRRLPFGKFLLR